MLLECQRIAGFEENQLVGVTSGGMPEVVVNGAQLAQTNIVRQP